MGYKFQFVTLAGFHALNHSMFELAHDYKDNGMAAYSKLQQAEFASETKVTQLLVTNVKLVLVTSMKYHKQFLVVHLLQLQWLVLQKLNNSYKSLVRTLKSPKF